jgi:hypothetical protein
MSSAISSGATNSASIVIDSNPFHDHRPEDADYTKEKGWNSTGIKDWTLAQYIYNHQDLKKTPLINRVSWEGIRTPSSALERHYIECRNAVSNYLHVDRCLGELLAREKEALSPKDRIRDEKQKQELLTLRPKYLEDIKRETKILAELTNEDQRKS